MRKPQILLSASREISLYVQVMNHHFQKHDKFCKIEIKIYFCTCSFWLTIWGVYVDVPECQAATAIKFFNFFFLKLIISMKHGKLKIVIGIVRTRKHSHE